LKEIRKIEFFENHFVDFYSELEQKIKDKINYVFYVIKFIQIVPTTFLKHIEGTDGLYEIRVEYKSNIYRIFCCFDHGNVVVLFNAFQKKTSKLPAKEIEKALRLKNEYFDKKSLGDDKTRENKKS